MSNLERHVLWASVARLSWQSGHTTDVTIVAIGFSIIWLLTAIVSKFSSK
jgi:hypothetical protein